MTLSSGNVEDTEKRQKTETFDDMLSHVGDAGRYQVFLFIILLPFSFVYTFLYFGQFFITLIPEEYWCHIPELDNTNLTDLQKLVHYYIFQRSSYYSFL